MSFLNRTAGITGNCLKPLQGFLPLFPGKVNPPQSICGNTHTRLKLQRLPEMFGGLYMVLFLEVSPPQITASESDIFQLRRKTERPLEVLERSIVVLELQRHG
ncbi:MAG TPA: hypothetical protein VML75_07865, partial [Kofleriaceae bacterium]|nr:hypothetical protein [Kofleriaceae bacterium]